MIMNRFFTCRVRRPVSSSALAALLVLLVPLVPPARKAMPVPPVRGRPESVGLPGIHHQLGGHATTAKRLVELLGVEDRHVPVVLAAHEQRGRLHVLHPVERADALPPLPGATGRTAGPV